jgi:hypothetical protein
VGLIASLEALEKTKNLLTSPGIKSQFPGCPAHGLITVPTSSKQVHLKRVSAHVLSHYSYQQLPHTCASYMPVSGNLNVPSGIKILWYGFVSLSTEYILNIQHSFLNFHNLFLSPSTV